MFNSKSFLLISDEEAKKQREQLCESQKCHWTKCLSLPVLIGFMLLLILTNVDFTDNAYATTTSITNESQNLEGLLNMDIARSSTKCRDIDCHISCTDGTIVNLYEEIGSLASRCDQALDVRLEYCKFSYGIMDAKFFTGNYRLKSFVIYDCDLAKIEANTFKQASVTDLTNMTFIKTNINSLNELTFLGLDSLEYFTMVNNKIYTTFNGVGFLEPISDTITEVVVQQFSDNNKKYDPTNWLKSKRDQTKLLNVDLSGNIFHDTLTSVTFVNLVQVQRLILSNSYITTIEIGTFDKIIKTLAYLDLSNNQLTTLSGDFLATNSMPGFHMELHDNAWNCDCANYELVKFIKRTEIEFTMEPKCSTPAEFKDMNIKLITIECEEETTTAEPTTKSTQTSVSTKTTELTTTESDSTDESDQTDETTTDIISTTDIIWTTVTEPQTTIIWTTVTATQTTGTTNTIWTTITPSTTSAPSKGELVECETGETYPTYSGVKKYDEFFSIEPISSTSVQLNWDSVKNLNFIYFTPKSENASIFNIDSNEYIEDLTTNVGYLFCLISHDEYKISPFNCRAQYLIEGPKEAWLLHSDTALFISLSVIGVAICVVCGVAVIYWTLRWRPTWLKGNKRLLKISSISHEVFLLPKDEAEQQYIFSEIAKTTPVDCLKKDSYDYMEFFKNLELSPKKVLHFPESEPPSDYAPTIPSSKTHALRYSSIQPTKYSADLTQEQLDNDGYESVDFYEEIC